MTAEKEKEEDEKKQEQALELKISKEKLLKLLPYIIILIATIYGIYIISQLFSPGVPMNIDLPGKYERVWCYSETAKEAGLWSLPTTMCHYKNAGDVLFQSYPPLFYILSYIFSIFGGLEAGFKIALVLAYFLLPIGAFVLLKKLEQPLAGSFAFAFLLLEHGGWHLGGFEQIFLVGMSSNSLSSGFFVLTLAFLIDLFRKPTTKTFIITAVLAALLFLSHGVPFIFLLFCIAVMITFKAWHVMKKHPTFFLAYPALFGILTGMVIPAAISLIVIAGVAWYNRKVLRQYNSYIKMAVWFPIIMLLLMGFWIAPYAMKSTYFAEGTIMHMDVSGIRDFFWTPINKIIFTLGILGMISVFFVKSKNQEAYKWLAVSAATLPLLWLFSMHFTAIYETLFKMMKYLIMIRLHAELRSLIFIFAALFLGMIAAIKIKTGKDKTGKYKTAQIGLLVALIIFVFACHNALYGSYSTIGMSKGIMTSENPSFKYQEQTYQFIKDAKGRVLVEDTLYNFAVRDQNGNVQTMPQHFSHSFCVAAPKTNKEILGRLTWYYYKYNYETTQTLDNNGQMLAHFINQSLISYPKDNLQWWIKRLNIEYIIAYTSQYTETFGNKMGYTVAGQIQPWTIFKTNITPSYFDVDAGNAEFSNEVYKGLSAKVDINAKENSAVIFKVLNYPNWQAKIDGKTVSKETNNLDGFTKINVPAGQHTIELKYRMMLIDYLAYLITLLGIVIIVLIWKGKIKV